MKFIHTSDWHIGKIVNEYYMTEDQKFVLNQLFNIIEEEKPDALVIAGDLYDRSVAPVEAIELLNDTINKVIVDLKTPIIAIAGNHDSGERLEFASSLLKDKSFYISGTLNKNIEKITLCDDYGNVNFYMIPYAEPAIVRALYEDKEIRDYDDAMRVILENIKENMNKDERNVIVAHGYVTYAKDAEGKEFNSLERSDSERPLSIGGSEYINSSYFNDFNYTALGHLHGRQKVGNENIRYAGSLYKYSFSEVKQKKGVNIVSLDEKGECTVEFREFELRRDFRIIKGELNNLLDKEVYSKENREDYLKVILTDEGEVLEPMRKLKMVYPNVMELTYENSLKERSEGKEKKSFKEKSKIDLFKSFYKDVKGKECSEEGIKLMETLIENVERKEV